MAKKTATNELERFATGVAIDGLEVHRATVALDERLDGELFTRITLLVNDPGPGKETWEFEAVRELKRELARKAVDLDLPSASVTLVPDSEAELVDAFAS